MVERSSDPTLAVPTVPAVQAAANGPRVPSGVSAPTVEPAIAVAVPVASVPDPTAPEVTLPTVTVPAVTVPTVTVPTVVVPNVQLPTIPDLPKLP